jgi:competence protein ComEA
MMTGLGRYLVIAALSIILSGPSFAQTTSPSSPSRTPARSQPATTSPSQTDGSQQQVGLVDINSASAEELDKLPGVGPARVKAIIANRPYNGKDDLVQRKILPSNVYGQIKDKIVARQGATKQ